MKTSNGLHFYAEAKRRLACLASCRTDSTVFVYSRFLCFPVALQCKINACCFSKS